MRRTKVTVLRTREFCFRGETWTPLRMNGEGELSDEQERTGTLGGPIEMVLPESTCPRSTPAVRDEVPSAFGRPRLTGEPRLLQMARIQVSLPCGISTSDSSEVSTALSVVREDVCPETKETLNSELSMHSCLTEEEQDSKIVSRAMSDEVLCHCERCMAIMEKGMRRSASKRMGEE